MPLINVKCASCEAVNEVFRHHSDWPKTPPCPSCEGETEQIHLPKGMTSYAPAVVVFQAPDGSFRYPGDTEGSSVSKYERLGYTRVEARGWAEVRSLERQLNVHERAVMAQSIERRQAVHEASMKQRRSDVYEGLKNGFQLPEIDPRTGRETGRMKTVKMSPIGRDIMFAAMQQNDRKPGPKMRDPGTHVEVYSQYRSNRDESRDERGGRRHD